MCEVTERGGGKAMAQSCNNNTADQLSYHGGKFCGQFMREDALQFFFGHTVDLRHILFSQINLHGGRNIKLKGHRVSRPLHCSKTDTHACTTSSKHILVMLQSL